MSDSIGRAELSNEAHSLRLVGRAEDAEVLECLADLLSDIRIEVDESFDGEEESAEYFLWEMLNSILKSDQSFISGGTAPARV